MLNRLYVQYAVLCLKVLGEKSPQYLSSKEIGRSQGIPLAQCDAVLRKLSGAGLIEAGKAKRYALRTPAEDVNPLDILRALATRRGAPDFHLLFAAHKTALQKVLHTVRWSEARDVYPSDGGSLGE